MVLWYCGLVFHCRLSFLKYLIPVLRSRLAVYMLINIFTPPPTTAPQQSEQQRRRREKNRRRRRRGKKKEKEEVQSCLCYFNASKDLVLFERGMWI